MSDKLYSVVNFTGIAIGATAALPHGLTVGGVGPVVPDWVLLQFSQSFELVSATTTTLTIRNTDNASGDCLALCHAIHPVERSFGLTPDDGTFSQHLTPQPFCPGSPNASGGGQAFDTIVFRPGGTATQNVAATWADAVSLLATLQGTRRLEFDDSVVSPIVIPAGTYDMTGVTWASVPDRQSRVTVVEGTTFSLLRAFDGVAVTFSGTTAPVRDFQSTSPQIDTVTMTNNATFVMSGAGPFFDIDMNAVFVIGSQSGLFAGTHAVMNIEAGNTVTVFQQGPLSAISDGTISGANPSTLNLVVADAAPFAASSAQPGYLGTLNAVNDTQDRTYPTAVITGLDSLNTASQLVQVDPSGGAFVLNLPAAADFRGQSITIKNITASTNNVTITPAGGDNIDGGATLVKGVAHFCVRLTSDGVHAWYVTASV